MSFKTFTEEQTKEAQTFIAEYQTQLYGVLEHLLEEAYGYDVGDLTEFLEYTPQQIMYDISDETEQFTEVHYIPETVADYLAHSNLGIWGDTPFDWLIDNAETEEDRTDAVARCVLWARFTASVIDDLLSNVAVTIYDADKTTSLVRAQVWGNECGDVCMIYAR